MTMVALRKSNLFLRTMFIAAIALLFGGCYTFTGSTLPAHLKTIQVLPVEDNTLNPVFAEKMTQSLISGFESRSSLRAVNQNPHCELKTILKSYSHVPYNTSGSDVTSYRIDVKISVQFFDRVKNKMLFEEDNLPGFGTYSVTNGQTESEGQEATIASVVEIILNNTVSQW